MRPRVHRHLAGRVRQLAADLRELPDHTILSEGYQMARQMMLDQISLAMKYSMRADVYAGRAEKPEATHMREAFDVEANRKHAAVSWWGFRRAVRKADLYHSFARVLLEFDQDQINHGEAS